MKNMKKILEMNGVKMVESKGANGELIIAFPGTSMETYGYPDKLKTAPVTEEHDIDVALTEALVALGMLEIKKAQKENREESRHDD